MEGPDFGQGEFGVRAFLPVNVHRDWVRHGADYEVRERQVRHQEVERRAEVLEGIHGDR